MWALCALPGAGPDQELAVFLALFAMELVNRHKQIISTTAYNSSSRNGPVTIEKAPDASRQPLDSKLDSANKNIGQFNKTLSLGSGYKNEQGQQQNNHVHRENRLRTSQTILMHDIAPMKSYRKPSRHGNLVSDRHESLAAANHLSHGTKMQSRELMDLPDSVTASWRQTSPSKRHHDQLH